MELRQTEEKVNELIAIYERLRATSLTHSEKMKLPELGGKQAVQQQDPSVGLNETSADDVLSQLRFLQTSIEDLQSKIDRFRKRLGEKDPVTGNPRYGSTATARVTDLIFNYDQLVAAMAIIHESRVVDELEQTVVELELEKRKQFEEEQRREQETIEARQRAQQEQLLQIQKQQEEAEAARQREVLELRRRAEESRQARIAAEEARLAEALRIRDEQLRRDREWMDGILKGTDGVQHELAKLRDATKDDAPARMAAITALHRLFSQIVRHPEEPNFRRIRRDHEKFNADIGRHDGGKEVLIAAGFRLGAIDDIPCFVSIEPNIENDMDGWSDWFNLLKATLHILEQELLVK